MFMFQTSKSLEFEYTQARIIFYLAGSVVTAMGLFSLGHALQHVKMSNANVPSAFTLIVTVITVLLALL